MFTHLSYYFEYYAFVSERSDGQKEQTKSHWTESNDHLSLTSPQNIQSIMILSCGAHKDV